MESKRKSSTAADEGGEDRASKRRRLPDPERQATATKGLELLRQIRNLKDRTGRQVAEAFFELPPKEDLPEYYAIIKLPVSLEEIETQLKRNELPSLSALESSFHRMVVNASTFNEDDSEIVKDANAILKTVTAFMKKENSAYSNSKYKPYPTPIEDTAIKADEDGENDVDTKTTTTTSAKITISRKAKSSTPAAALELPSVDLSSMTFQQAQEYVVNSMMTHRQSDDDGARFTDFLNLPSRSMKEYYHVIPHPVCLKKLWKRVRGVHGRDDPTGISDFKTWAALEDEASYVWKNAYHYNEDGSIIHDLAKELEAYFYKLFNQAKSAVPEPTAPKLKLKLAASAPTPEAAGTSFKLKLGAGKAGSPAEAVTISLRETTLPDGMPLPPQTLLTQERKASSSKAASPTPKELSGVVKNEEARPSPAINGLTAYSNGISAMQTNGATLNTHGMSQPGTPGQNPYFPSNQPQQSQYIPPPPSPGPAQPLIGEQRLRQPGKTATDAMIASVSISTHPGLMIPVHTRLRLPASRYAISSHVITIPSTHYYLQIKPLLSPSVLGQHHKLFVTSGNQRLHAIPSIPGHPVDAVEPLFETRLLNGVTPIEIELIAALPRGEKDAYDGRDAVLERITLFVHMLKPGAT